MLESEMLKVSGCYVSDMSDKVSLALNFAIFPKNLNLLLLLLQAIIRIIINKNHRPTSCVFKNFPDPS